jgi:hypothetical protein
MEDVSRTWARSDTRSIDEIPGKHIGRPAFVPPDGNLSESPRIAPWTFETSTRRCRYCFIRERTSNDRVSQTPSTRAGGVETGTSTGWYGRNASVHDQYDRADHTF